MKSMKLMSLFILGAVAMSFTVLPAAKTNLNCFLTSPEFSSVTWQKDVIDLGEIPQGKPVTVEFEFTNTGKSPVIIASATTSCGCTVADYPKEPILPGKSGKIVASYNAAAKGVFTKNVMVMIQNEDPKTLTLKGTVL